MYGMSKAKYKSFFKKVQCKTMKLKNLLNVKKCIKCEKMYQM